MKAKQEENNRAMAHPAGVEPAASASGGQRSIQLSYGCSGRNSIDNEAMCLGGYCNKCYLLIALINEITILKVSELTTFSVSNFDNLGVLKIVIVVEAL